MKNQSKIIKYLTQTFCLVFGLALAWPAVAADRWFDGGITNIPVNGNGLSQGSAGNWDNTLMNWDQGSGLAHVAWNSGNLDTAFHAMGANHIVTLTDNITVGALGLTQQNANTTLTILGAFTLTLGGNNPAIDSGTVATSGINIGTTNATVLAGTHGLIKNGLGPLTLRGTGSHPLTGGITVNAGTVTASYADSSLSSGLLASANDVTLRGGNFSLVGKSTSASSQTLGNLIFGTAGGRSLVSMTLNATTNTTLQMSSLVRTNNAQLQYTTTAAGLGGLTCTTLPTFVNGVVPWMTVFDNFSTYRFAATNSGGYFVTNTPDGLFANPTTINTGSATGNYDLTSAVGTTADNVSVNTLRLTTTGGITTNSAGKSFTVNGLLNAANVAWTLSGDPITIGSANELVLNAPFATGFTINSVIQNNGSNPSMLTAGGVATPFLTLNANNTYSGTTTINGANAYNASGSVVVNSFQNINTASPFGMNNTLTLNGATILTTPASAQATDRPMTWLGNCGIYNKSTANNVTFNGRISGLGTCNIDQDPGSGGFVILGGDNDYSGEFQFQTDGRLTLASVNAVSNATLNVNGQRIQLTQSGNYPYNIGGLKGNFALDFNLGSATAGSGGGKVNLGWNNQTNAYQGALSGTCGLIKKGTGIQTLVKCAYTGDTVLEAGTLKLGVGTSKAFTGAIALDASYPGSRSVLTMTVGNTTGLAVGQVVPQTGGLVITAIETSTKVALNSSTFTLSSYSDTIPAMDGSLASTNLEIKAGATFDVATLTSGYTLGASQTLKGGGTFIGALTVPSGGIIQLGAAGSTLTLSNAVASAFNSGSKLKIIASGSLLDKVSASATSGNSVAGLDLIIDTTTLLGDVPSTTIYSAGGPIAGPFNSFTVIGDTSYTPTLDYSTSGEIKLALSRTPAITPTITVLGSLAAVNTTYGTASPAPAIFYVRGEVLTGDLTVSPPAGYEISLSSASGYSDSLTLTASSGTVSKPPVYLRLKAANNVAGSPYSGNFTVSGGGATDQTIAAASSTVAPALLTITANAQSKMYGTTQTTPVSGSTDFVSSALQNSETVGTVTLSYGAGALTATAAAGSTSTITPSAATGGTFDANNYTITYNTGTLTVTKAPLTITASGQNKIYGTTQATPVSGSTAFSSSALQNSETIGTVTLSYGAGALTAAAPVGSTSTITPSAATGGSFTTNNYSITYNTGTLNVNPRPVVLTGTRIYDTTNTAGFNILSVSNSVNADGVSLVSGTAVLASENAGTNAISSFGDLVLDTGVGTNYTLVGASGFVVITPKALTVSGLSVTSTNKVYDASTSASGSGTPALGSAEDPGTGTGTDGYPYTGDDVTLLGTPGYAYNTKDVLTANSIQVTGLSLSGVDNANYSISQAFPATISPAPLTVTADNDSKTYGQIKSYGAGSTAFTHGALQDSETLATVTLTASGGTNATDNVGNYNLTPSSALGGNGFSSANYAINYLNGTLAVNPVTPTVTVTVGTYTYSGLAQGPTSYTTSPVGDTGSPTWSYAGTGTTTYGPSASLPITPGSYDATVSLAADVNFNAAASGPTAFTISPVNTPTTITFTVSGGSMNLSWPSDHLGWGLQCQTNTLATGLGNGWVTIPGSESVTSTNFPIGLSNPSVFYRLVLP